jgi:hypothetical protein
MPLPSRLTALPRIGVSLALAACFGKRIELENLGELICGCCLGWLVLLGIIRPAVERAHVKIVYL